MADTDLVTADDVGDYLLWSDAQRTANASRIGRFISAVTTVVESITGPVVEQTFDEWRDGGWYQIVLDNFPVTAVTLVTEAWGANTVYTLTNEPLDGTGDGDAYGYTVNLAHGTITRRSVGRQVNFPAGRENVHITYTAGYCADTASVPPAVAEAALVIIADNWRILQGGNRATRPPIDSSEGSTVKGYFVPYAAMELLAPYRTRQGVA